MSTQKGNSNRSRPQKYQNSRAFKNNLHDNTKRTKLLNSIQISDVCFKCREILQWKIKYKKYKIPSQPGSCVKCSQKNVKKAYHTICSECTNKLKLCGKCGESKELVPPIPSQEEQIKIDAEIQIKLKLLPERKKRTFIRFMNKKNDEKSAGEDIREELLEKLKSMKVSQSDSESDSELRDDDSESDSDEEQ